MGEIMIPLKNFKELYTKNYKMFYILFFETGDLCSCYGRIKLRPNCPFGGTPLDKPATNMANVYNFLVERTTS